MDRGLVIIDETDAHREILAEAGRFARGSDAELVLFSYLTEAEYESNLETMEQVGSTEHKQYRPDVAVRPAEQLAKDMADEALEDADVPYEVVTHVIDEGELAREILTVADEEACDHVFLVGKQRSPTGKAVFGDVTQRIILDFPGRVTSDLS
ncbi:universal stress protein [Halorubrum gandharaense]